MGKTNLTSNKDPSTGVSGGERNRDSAEGQRDGVGEALKSVYGDMLDEAIPAEMLALLGKLT